MDMKATSQIGRKGSRARRFGFLRGFRGLSPKVICDLLANGAGFQCRKRALNVAGARTGQVRKKILISAGRQIIGGEPDEQSKRPFFHPHGHGSRGVQASVNDALKGSDDGELYLEYRQSESFASTMPPEGRDIRPTQGFGCVPLPVRRPLRPRFRTSQRKRIRRAAADSARRCRRSFGRCRRCSGP